MSMNAKSVTNEQKSEKEFRNILNALWSARTVGEAHLAAGRLQQFTTEQRVLRKLRELQTRNKETVTLENWLSMMAKEVKMVDASKLLNKNAWKIQGIVLVPAYGEDPETEWTGFLHFIDSPEIQVMADSEFCIVADDYREIIKKMAILSEILDIGE